jgi:hypothetical protein
LCAWFLDLIAYIRHRRPAARIVVMTGRWIGGVQAELSAAHCSVDGLTAKPFHLEALWEVLETASRSGVAAAS